MTNVVQLKREPGAYWLRDLPRRGRVSDLTVSSGWTELDEIWKLYPGQFTIVTGIAGHGKSTFVQNLVIQYARLHGMKSWMYVPENESFLHEKFQLLWGDHPDWETFGWSQCMVQSAMPEFYDDDPKTLPWVLDRAVAAVRENGIDLVFVDPWNELERAKARDQMTTEYIAECLQYLKAFARVMNVAVILIAHPTKAGLADGKVPGLADIEGSLAWFNKCDNGLIVHREPDTTTTRVISAKAREIGSGRRGQVYFTVDPSTGRFAPQYGAVL